MQSTQTLVLGTAWGYQIRDVRPFVESLRRHYDGTVILLVNSKSSVLVEYLASRGIMPVFFDCPYWMVVHVQLGRYVRYGELLRAMNRHDRVLLTDVSDVTFQANPFDSPPPGELLCFMEPDGRLIGDDPSNCTWIQQLFGPEVLEALKNKPISCSGTTLGTRRAVLEYIDLLLAQANPQILKNYMQTRGHDQGIHNFLLHTGALPLAKMIPNGQHVWTLGAVPDDQIIITPDGFIADRQGRKPAIVHQFTYKEQPLRHVRSLYPMD